MRHTFFIGCVCLALAIALFTGVFAIMGWGSLLGEVGATVLYPFQWAAAQVGNAVSGFGAYFQDMDKLLAENESLRAENESLQAELTEYEILADENAWLYRYLSMKQEHSDYAMCAASVISTSSGIAGAFATELTLNKGHASGIEPGMPVVTPVGLVGVVVDVGPYHCRVSTLLHTSVSVGAIATRGAAAGLCEGDLSHIHDGKTTLRYLPESADIATGDTVVTSGLGSVYPYGIPIGTVDAVTVNPYSRTLEATVTPYVDLSCINGVAILTAYEHTTAPAETGEEVTP